MQLEISQTNPVQYLAGLVIFLKVSLVIKINQQQNRMYLVGNNV